MYELIKTIAEYDDDGMIMDGTLQNKVLGTYEDKWTALSEMEKHFKKCSEEENFVKYDINLDKMTGAVYYERSGEVEIEGYIIFPVDYLSDIIED